MTVSIVDAFEIIHIEHKKCDRKIFLPSLLEIFRDLFSQVASIVNMCQLIGVDEFKKLFISCWRCHNSKFFYNKFET